MPGIRTLMVDLNNLSRYPTLGIGYLVASLRGAGIEVEVLVPLLHGVPPYVREKPQDLKGYLRQRAIFALHPAIAPARDKLGAPTSRAAGSQTRECCSRHRPPSTERRPDVLLLSAYLDHRPSVMALCELAAADGIPVLLGGPAFADPEVARTWLDIPGLTAIVGAEADFSLPGIVGDLVAGRDLTGHAGVFLPDGRQGPPGLPLRDLAKLPIPDFSDFPWHLYQTAVVPVMTGRGCSWGRCLFCSDIETANGRTFRSRPIEAIFDEITQQTAKHEAKQVAFLDIKLNGDLAVWRGIAERFPAARPGWHLGRHGARSVRRRQRAQPRELEQAYASGMRRISCGLETGSERVNNSMAKGTKVERTSKFIRDAYAVGSASGPR